MSHKYLLLLSLIALSLAACGAPSAEESQQLGSPDAAALSEGQRLFALNCGECHSDDGSGSDEAPAVFGHTVEQVEQQVRQPEGEMDAIDATALSDADLALIARYIASLPGEEAHPDIEPSDEERVHLMAAYEAIEDHENMDRQVAIDHLNQAAALANGDATDLYQEMIESIERGKAGNARHELKELLGMEEEH